MRVLIVTFGSHGDLHPFLAIGRTLAARGHECAVVTDPYFTRDVASAGLAMYPVREAISFADLLRHPHLFHRHHGPGLLASRFDAVAPCVIEALRRGIEAHRPDVILAHYVAIPASWIAEECGIPLATAVLAPLAWLAPDDPVPLLQVEPGAWRERRARVLARALGPVARIVSNAWVNRMRVRNGFAPARDPMAGAFRGGDLNLALWSEAFRGPLPSDPAQGVICGFPWYDGEPGARLEAGLERFLSVGEPPIVFTLGSAAVHTARGFFGIAARACSRIGRRGVLIVGRGIAPPEELPPGVIGVPWAPHSALFPRALVNVHHGGIGSTAQALRAGRPTLAIPHAYDQFNNALRVMALGAGLMLSRHRMTAARLAEALDRCIDDPTIAARAKTLGERLAHEDGAAIAADQLERLADTPRRAAA
jgi:rhamnosyltransferase subunit B